MTEVIEPGSPGSRAGWDGGSSDAPGRGSRTCSAPLPAHSSWSAWSRSWPRRTNTDPTTPGVLFCLVLIVAALLLGMRAPGPIRAACVTATVLAVPLLWFFGFFGGGSAGRGELRGVYLLTLVSYALLYLLTWTKGRAIFLAGALLVFASWVTFEVGDATPASCRSRARSRRRATRTTFGTARRPVDLLHSSDTTDGSATAALVIGLVFLGAAVGARPARLEGAATPFVAVGAIETLAGAIVLGGNDSLLLGGLLAIASVRVVGLVGGHGDRRRATTWIGVLVVFGGCVAIIADIAPSSAAARRRHRVRVRAGARLPCVVARAGARRTRRRRRRPSPAAPPGGSTRAGPPEARPPSPTRPRPDARPSSGVHCRFYHLQRSSSRR